MNQQTILLIVGILAAVLALVFIIFVVRRVGKRKHNGGRRGMSFEKPPSDGCNCGCPPAPGPKCESAYRCVDSSTPVIIDNATCDRNDPTRIHQGDLQMIANMVHEKAKEEERQRLFTMLNQLTSQKREITA